MRRERYIQGAIWAYIRRNPGARVRDIAAAVQAPRNSTTHALKRMREAGSVRREGATHLSVWYVCGPQPVCMYGMAVNSLANLQHTQSEWRAYLRLAMIAKGYDPNVTRPPKPPKPLPPKTELERHWCPGRAAIPA